MSQKYFLAFAIILISTVFADSGSIIVAPLPDDGNGNKCHNSCSQCQLNVCKACIIPNSKVDTLKRACVCNDGYYAVSISPLVCQEKISGNEIDQCEKNMGINVEDFLIHTLCYYFTENLNSEGQKDFVIFEVTIDTDHSFFDENGCRNRLQTQIQYLPKNKNYSKESDNYIALDLNYISSLGTKRGNKKIKIPLIYIYEIAHSTTINTDQSQIVQLIQFRILLGYDRGNKRINLRAHKWIMTVYTNRKQVQTFTIDVDIQRTESCQDLQQCVVISDLDVTGNQYLQNFETIRPNSLYFVGDWMYMRIWFKDTTYLKQLSFQKLYFQNERGQIFDHTSLTDGSETKWNHAHNSLHVKLKLIEPSAGAHVQVDMLIETADARRFLQDSESIPVKQQFKAILFNPTQVTHQHFINEITNSLRILLGLANLLALLFLF